MDMSQGESLPSSSTNGVRGHKRPRYPKKHLVTCNDAGNTAASIPCECDKYEQDQRGRNGKYGTISRKILRYPILVTHCNSQFCSAVNFVYHVIGYYESESDDIDVPLSKRINRLNIENPAIADRSHASTSQYSVNAGNISNIPAGATNQPQNIENVNSTMWQSNSHMGNFGKERTISSQHSDDNHHVHQERLLPDSSFSDRYNYPENSQYYQSNQLLYDLYRERQMRQNNSTL